MVDASLLYPGVKVRIIDSWDKLPSHDRWQAPSGKMDHWLGQIVTIKKVTKHGNGWFKIEEDIDENACGGWVWKANGFSEIVDERPEPEESGMDLMTFLML